MAAVSATSLNLRSSSFKPARISNQENGISSSVKFISTGMSRGSFPSLRSSRLRICCAAKPETVNKVIEIVKKQLALADETAVTPSSKFSDLGADSLDTVEIVMNLEEEFDISVEEDSSQNITTVQEAADLIDQIVDQKALAP